MVPTLYILMRDDLASLNPGKAIAQATHATNQFEMAVQDAEMDYETADGFDPKALADAVTEWREDRDFGRCLTVAAKPHQIEELMGIFDDGNSAFIGGMVIDPTYPISDGEVVHAIELMTCGWVFVWEQEDKTWADEKILRSLKRLSLYK